MTLLKMHSGILVVAMAFAVVTRAAVVPPTTRPDYAGYSQSYHINYSNKTPINFDKLSGMSVRASINGGPVLNFTVDTGSWGIVVGAGDVPNIDPNAPPGELVYSSSGNGYFGKWTTATVVFPDSKDEHGNVATAIVPVLAADTYKFKPGAVNGGNRPATQRSNPKVYMFGIGSGRGPEQHQDRNPWVNLKEMRAGTMRRGYTLTRDGITLGLTAKDVGEGYVYEKLTEHTGGSTTQPAPVLKPDGAKDWDGSTGWATVGDQTTRVGNVLLDTGLTNMMVDDQDVGDKQVDVPAGTPVTVYLLGGKLHYSFTVGDAADPTQPRRVTRVKRQPASIINTGLKVLALYDYLYDADGGYLGLRPTTPRGRP